MDRHSKEINWNKLNEHNILDYSLTAARYRFSLLSQEKQDAFGYDVMNALDLLHSEMLESSSLVDYLKHENSDSNNDIFFFFLATVQDSYTVVNSAVKGLSDTVCESLRKRTDDTDSMLFKEILNVIVAVKDVCRKTSDRVGTLYVSSTSKNTEQWEDTVQLLNSVERSADMAAQSLSAKVYGNTLKTPRP